MTLFFYPPHCFSNFWKGVLSAAWTFMEEEGGHLSRGQPHEEAHNEAGSQILASGDWTGNFLILIECLGPLGNSPQMKDDVPKLNWNVLIIWAIM